MFCVLLQQFFLFVFGKLLRRQTKKQQSTHTSMQHNIESRKINNQAKGMKQAWMSSPGPVAPSCACSIIFSLLFLFGICTFLFFLLIFSLPLLTTRSSNIKNSTPAHKCSENIHPLMNSSSDMMGIDAPPVTSALIGDGVSASSNTPSPHIKPSHCTASTCKRRLSIKNRHYMDGKRV